MPNKRVITAHSITLGESKKTSRVTITRVGTFKDPRYGEFSITLDMLNKMVENFKANAYGQDIAIDVAHNPSNGAAGKITTLSVEGQRLRALVEWTGYGVQAINNKGFNYLSAEYAENFTDNEQGKEHGCVLLGAGLTVRPVIKHLDKVELSTPDGADVTSALETNFLKQLQQEPIMKKYLKQLLALASYKLLAESVQTQIKTAFETTAKTLSDDALKDFYTSFETTVKVLSENIGDTVVKLDIGAITPDDSTPGASIKVLDEEAITKLVAKQLSDAQDAEAKKLAEAEESLTANIKLFSETVTGDNGVSDDIAKTLSEDYKDLITSQMNNDQVVTLAVHAVKTHNKSVADKKLAGLGWVGAGNPHVNNQGALSLQESIDSMLAKTSSGRSFALSATDKGKKLLSEHPFVEQVLNAFDSQNALALEAESKALAEGVGIANTNLPVGFQRTVIREALSDLNVLSLVNTMTDASATMTTEIPYEERGSIGGDGRVFEGQGIGNAGVTQKMDTAFLEPIKLALQVSNEVMHFSRSSQINWDAYARNVASNARLVREIVARKITNEMVRAADSFGAISITAENVAPQLKGSNSLVKTAKFPIVQPKQTYSLKGDKVGTASNPLTVTLLGSKIDEYSADVDQANGTYWKLVSANLGYIGFVDQDGNSVNPGEFATCTIGYDYATNIKVFDLNVPAGVALEDHMDGLLRSVGSRKAYLSGTHFVQPDFMLMSPTLNDMATNARGYTANAARQGSRLNASGDLEVIKGLPAFSTNAPGTQLGDSRILMGQAGTTTYSVAKAFMTGQPFEAVDSQGRPTGQKVAYGEEYSSVHTPKSISRYYTSVLAIDLTNR